MESYVNMIGMECLHELIGYNLWIIEKEATVQVNLENVQLIEN